MISLFAGTPRLPATSRPSGDARVDARPRFYGHTRVSSAVIKGTDMQSINAIMLRVQRTFLINYLHTAVECYLSLDKIASCCDWSARVCN